jgi:hypothetical protein
LTNTSIPLLGEKEHGTMSRWKRRLLKGCLAIGAGTLFVGSAVSDAAAATTRLYTGGATLQNVVQADWITAHGINALYYGVGSGAGLANWGAVNSSPALGNPLYGYVGTDDPPTSTQISNSASVAGTTPITVPVAQAPVAVLIGLPTGVTVSSGPLRLTNLVLTQVAGNLIPRVGSTYAANTWGAFLTAAGATFSGGATELALPVKIEVRNATSGTTFAFKNYLAKVDALLGGTLWSTYNNGDVTWPGGLTTAGGNAETTRCRTANSGGGALVGNVAAAGEGAIGYANLADAVSTFSNTWRAVRTATRSDCSTVVSHDVAYALVQNNGISVSPNYADPINSNRANVNTSGDWTDIRGNAPRSYPTALQSWFDGGITANNPLTGVQGLIQRYGIVAGTYILVWDDYGASNLQTAYANSSYPAASPAYGRGFQDIEDTACDHAKWIVGASPYTTTNGQTFIASQSTYYYAALPTNVLAAAKASVASCG